MAGFQKVTIVIQELPDKCYFVSDNQGVAIQLYTLFTCILLRSNLYNDLERPSKPLLLYKTIRLQFANKNNRMSKLNVCRLLALVEMQT